MGMSYFSKDVSTFYYNQDVSIWHILEQWVQKCGVKLSQPHTTQPGSTQHGQLKQTGVERGSCAELGPQIFQKLSKVE